MQLMNWIKCRYVPLSSVQGYEPMWLPERSSIPFHRFGLIRRKPPPNQANDCCRIEIGHDIGQMHRLLHHSNKLDKEKKSSNNKNCNISNIQLINESNRNDNIIYGLQCIKVK